MELKLILKGLFCFFYGLLVASAYLFYKYYSHDGGQLLFGYSAFFAFLLHLLLFPKSIIEGFLSPNILIRGLAFSFAQILIFKAQRSSLTSFVFATNLIGLVSTTILAKVFLEEKIAILMIIAFLLCITGFLLTVGQVSLYYGAILAGIIQAFTNIFSKKILNDKLSTISAISVGYFFSFTLSLLFFFEQYSQTPTIDYKIIFVATIVIIIVQYAFFKLYSLLQASRASIISVTRVPWAIILENFTGHATTISQIVSAALISLSGIILAVEKLVVNKKNRKVI